jgi:hypothetical protein
MTSFLTGMKSFALKMKSFSSGMTSSLLKMELVWRERIPIDGKEAQFAGKATKAVAKRTKFYS